MRIIYVLLGIIEKFDLAFLQVKKEKRKVDLYRYKEIFIRTG